MDLSTGGVNLDEVRKSWSISGTDGTARLSSGRRRSKSWMKTTFYIIDTANGALITRPSTPVCWLTCPR